MFFSKTRLAVHAQLCGNISRHKRKSGVSLKEIGNFTVLFKRFLQKNSEFPTELLKKTFHAILVIKNV